MVATHRKVSVGSGGNQSPRLDDLMKNLENNSISTSPRNKCDPYRKYEKALEMLNQSLQFDKTGNSQGPDTQDRIKEESLDETNIVYEYGPKKAIERLSF